MIMIGDWVMGEMYRVKWHHQTAQQWGMDTDTDTFCPIINHHITIRAQRAAGRATPVPVKRPRATACTVARCTVVV
jgi:hypothetical protein